FLMRRSLVFLLVAFIAVALLSAPLWAADKYVIKIANVTAPEHPLHLSFEKMAEIMNERSGGRIEATAFPSAQLGNLRAISEGLQLGTIEMGTQSPGGLASFMPLLGVLELPYIYRDNQHVYRTVDGEIGQELNDLFREKTGIRILGYWMNLYRNTTNSKKPIVKPEDFKGLKIRVPETKTVMDTIAALGASPVPMTFGEVYTSLQQGVIDGQENPLSIIWASKLYEVQKYLSLTGHVYSPVVVMISDQFFNSLPEDLQEIVLQAFEEVRPTARQMVEDQELEILKNLKDKGMEINDVDKAEFAEYMSSIYDEFIKANGAIAGEYIERIKNIQ
ncbi:MAG: TRAP transporter substrate-binding protein, partial [Synergistales bacterium]|nr:TRAP transporter substrate-binding protein [Synergistales bacterium]